MSEITSQTRQAQYLQDVSAATARALSDRPLLHTRGAWFFDGENPLPLYAAHLSPEDTIEKQQLTLLRARADAVSQRLKHCDETLHKAHCPEPPIERMIFELLEQLRCESLASLKGVCHNLHIGFSDWSNRFAQSESSQSIIGLLLLTVSQIVYSRLNACMIEDTIADAIESTRAGIVASIGDNLICLRRHRHDQKAYIPHALSIARAINDSIIAEQQKQSKSTISNKFSASEFKLPLNFSPPPANVFPIAETSIRNAIQSQCGYTVWTRQYDEQKNAGKLVRAAQLKEYRKRLEKSVDNSKVNISRLARIFRSLLSQPHSAGWQFDEESGYLDPSRLSQLITQASEHRVFKTIANPPLVDCQVTLLIDCSGSMKANVDQFAPFAEIFSRAFEMAGAKTEILGFTTKAWNGGRPLKEWIKEGMPENSGRLNETLHLVFKSATQVHKRAKESIAAMYRSDLFREGVDGEALEWAISRLHLHAANRRLLFVLSDGCPMDRATEMANDGAQILEQHLTQVVSRHDGRDVEIYGLGLGLDLSLFYRHRLAFEQNNLLSQQSFLDIAKMISGRQKRLK